MYLWINELLSLLKCWKKIYFQMVKQPFLNENRLKNENYLLKNKPQNEDDFYELFN